MTCPAYCKGCVTSHADFSTCLYPAPPRMGHFRAALILPGSGLFPFRHRHSEAVPAAPNSAVPLPQLCVPAGFPGREAPAGILSARRRQRRKSPAALQFHGTARETGLSVRRQRRNLLSSGSPRPALSPHRIQREGLSVLSLSCAALLPCAPGACPASFTVSLLSAVRDAADCSLSWDEPAVIRPSAKPPARSSAAAAHFMTFEERFPEVLR